MSTPQGVSSKRFKDLIDNFQKLTEAHFVSRNAFHGHDRRYNYSHGHHGPAYTKGVKSDLVIVFFSRTSSVSEDTGLGLKRPIWDSVAFSFNLAQNGEGLEMTASTRIGGKIQSSAAFSEDAFRFALKGLNRTLKEEGVPTTLDGMFRVFRASMIDNPDLGISPFDQDSLIQKVVGSKVQAQLDDLKSKYESEQKAYQDHSAEVARIDQLIDQETKTSAEYLEVQRLERELEAAKKKLGERKSRRYKELEGSKSRKAAEKSFRTMSEQSRKIVALVQNIRARTPSDPASQAAVTKWIENNTNLTKI